MSKFLLIKIIGGFIAIAIVAGGISIWIKTHHSSVMVQEAQKILPARVNPLLNRSNEVYWFYNLFMLQHVNNAPNTNYFDCYLKGGFIPNEEMKKELIAACKITASKIMKYAHKKGCFTKATLQDWLDQRLLKKLFIQDEYINHKPWVKRSAAQDQKYKEPESLKQAAKKIVDKWASE